MRRIAPAALVALAALLAAGHAAAADEPRPGWSCRNTDAEISCADGACTVQTGDGFTPMHVTVDPGGASVCAYTGCWEGSVLWVEQAGAVYILGADLKWSQQPEADGVRFQIAIDTDRRLAVLNGEGWAHPMQCEPWTCGPDCQAARN